MKGQKERELGRRHVVERAILVGITLMLVASMASANSLTASGEAIYAQRGPVPIVDRLGLVNDGDFENGNCLHDSDWTCNADNGCNWIADIRIQGLWNFSGTQAAWLGGYCEGTATCSSSLCQDLFIDGTYLVWYWMAFLNDAVGTINVTVDGVVEFSHAIQPGDHLLDYQATHYADLSGYIGETHTICFEYDNLAACGENQGDNYFFDFVRINDTTASERLSFSTVKSIY